MPTQYKRKIGSTRGSWLEDDLKKAIDAVNNTSFGINEAARRYNIPKTTLKRKIKGDIVSKSSLGRNSTSKDMGRPTAQPTPREIDESKTLTPSKTLAILSPIPNVTKKVTARGKAASVAKILNSLESIQTIVTIKEKKEQLLKEKEGRKRLRELKRSILGPKTKKERPRPKIEKRSTHLKGLLHKSSSVYPFCKDSDDDDDIMFINENECVGCYEVYEKTTKSADWIKCTTCSSWMHENCTKFGEICDNCGKRELKKKRPLKINIKKEKDNL